MMVLVTSHVLSPHILRLSNWKEVLIDQVTDVHIYNFIVAVILSDP